MKLAYQIAGFPFGLLSALFFLSQAASQALAGEAKFEAQLVWASNDKKSPDPKHKPVSAEMREKLGKLHLKWENFFEVNTTAFSISKGGTNKVVMSNKCSLEVRLLEGDKVEVSVFGKKGDRSCKQNQPLPKGELMVFGGNAPDATAWLVVLRRVE